MIAAAASVRGDFFRITGCSTRASIKAEERVENP
jgi:hypothetical protein